MKTQITLVLILFAQLAFGQVDKSITTSAFTKNGSKLIITFDIPYSNPKLTYDLQSVTIVAEDNTVDATTISGDLKNLETGESYTITWDVLKDVSILSVPKSATINLTYTTESKQIIAKQEEQDRLRQQEQDNLAARKRAKDEAKQRKIERRQKKPFTMGIVGYGGVTYGIFENTDTDIMPEIGFGYGAGVEFEFRLGSGTYLQVEAAYMRQDLAYSHMGDDSEFNFSSVYVYDIEKARIATTDYRAYARIKFSDIFQVGGYFALNQTMVRKGELEYFVTFANGTTDSFSDKDFEYDLLGNNSLFPEDNDGATPGSKIDYGLTFGLETPTKSSLILGVGYDLSVQSIINTMYDGFNNTELIDIYPSAEADWRTGFGYVRLGVRF